MGVNREEEARRYFGGEGFRRLLAEIWKKYRSLAGARGTVKLEKLTQEECDAIGGFLSLYLRCGETRTVKLATFERELASTPFPCKTIPELYFLLNGKPLLTRSELSELQEKGWTAIFKPAWQLAEDLTECSAWVRDWLDRLQNGEVQGYRTLRELYRSNTEEAVAGQLCSVMKALMETDALVSDRRNSDAEDWPFGMVRLPILAARITGDSHAFDLKQPSGRLLWYALRERAALERTNYATSDGVEDITLNGIDTQVIRDVYRACGIRDDDLSSLVYIYVPRPQEEVHPTVLTLRQVERLSKEAFTYSDLYVVENPSVFSTLLDVTVRLQEKSMFTGQTSESLPVLVCTSGHPSLAAILFIKGCLEASGESCRLRYSGDFDGKGIEMGIQLAQRFPGKYEPWRFDRATYEQYAHRGPMLDESDVDWLAQLQLPWDPFLASAMSVTRHKCFQETFILELIRDWRYVLQIHWKLRG